LKKKYSANDYDYPLDIVGCKPEYSSVFRQRFTQTDEEERKIRKYVPCNYLKLMDKNQIDEG
jgi:hypothetical protein